MRKERVYGRPERRGTLFHSYRLTNIAAVFCCGDWFDERLVEQPRFTASKTNWLMWPDW
jgi:hypothetical protein